MIAVRDIAAMNTATRALPAEHVDTSARGAAGGVITPHRALATVQMDRRDITHAIALTVMMTLAALLATEPLLDAWGWVFHHGTRVLGLGGELRWIPFGILPDVPLPVIQAPPPGALGLVVAGALAAAMFVGAHTLGPNALPLAYLLRAVALVLGSAVFVFGIGIFPKSFALAEYAATSLKVSLGLWLCVPLALGGTLLLLDVPWRRKTLLIAAALAHLAILIPLQLLLTLSLVRHLTLVVVPLFFVFFSVVPQIGVLIALYSWGASWSENVE